MTRPANPSKKQADLRTATIPEGMKAIMLPEGMEIETEITLRPLETPAQRAHRHRMEVRQFWVKEAPVHLTAIGIAISGAVAALVLTFRPGSSVEDKKWAYSVLSYLLIGVVGFAFGKVAK
jgi:hypothetical protein